MKLIKTFWPAILIILFPVFSEVALEGARTQAQTAGKRVTVKTVNKLSLARPSQTIEIMAKDLASLGEKDLNKIHVWDTAGKEVLSQSVDTDFDDYHARH